MFLVPSVLLKPSSPGSEMEEGTEEGVEADGS